MRKLETCLVMLGLAYGAPAPAATTEPGEEQDLFRMAMERSLDRARQEWLRGVELHEDHSTFDRAWVVEGTHYRVHSTRSHRFARQVAADLDAMVPEYQSILGTSFVPDKPFPVYVFDTLPEYNAFGEQHGAEHSSYYGAFYAAEHPDRPVAVMYLGHRDTFRMFVVHAAAHQFTHTAFGARLPLWLDEALASYFSLYWNYGFAVKRFHAMRERDQLVPFARLFANEAGEFADRSDDRITELGLVFTWLLWKHPDTASAKEDSGDLSPGIFLQFVRDLLTGQSPANHPFQTWLRENRPQLEADFKAYPFE